MDTAFNLSLGAANRFAGGGMLSSGSGDISSGPHQSSGPPLPITMSLSSPMIQPQEAFFEMVEVPAPLANPRTRKVKRSSRLNDKYARMKVRALLYCKNERN